MYAITKHSRRARGQAVACDLVRVVCRVKAVVGFRARLAEDFAGYLVTEPAALPVWRDFESGKVVFLIGRDYPVDFREGFCVSPGELIDATCSIASGSTIKYVTGAGKVCAARGAVCRDGWFA